MRITRFAARRWRIFYYWPAFSRFSIGRAAEIEPGAQSTFLHGMGSKSG
jgi:hypothetical protein